jgi:hypothetical protein
MAHSPMAAITSLVELGNRPPLRTASTSRARLPDTACEGKVAPFKNPYSPQYDCLLKSLGRRGRVEDMLLVFTILYIRSRNDRPSLTEPNHQLPAGLRSFVRDQGKQSSDRLVRAF